MDSNPMPAIRDERGRLLPGARIGIGNAGQRYRGEIRRALINAETPEDVRKAGQWLLELAHSRNVNVRTRLMAIRTWLEYVVGKPPKADDQSAPDDTGISAEDVLTTILEVLDRVPNGAEIKLQLAAAFRRLEVAHGLRGPVRPERN
jgi:hypothetical protein